MNKKQQTSHFERDLQTVLSNVVSSFVVVLTRKEDRCVYNIYTISIIYVHILNAWINITLYGRSYYGGTTLTDRQITNYMFVHIRWIVSKDSFIRILTSVCR